MSAPTFPAADLADLVDVSAPFTVRHEPTAVDTWGYEMPTYARLVWPAPMTDPAQTDAVEA